MILLLAVLAAAVYACSLAFYYGPYSGYQMGHAPSGENGPTLAEQLGYSRNDILVIVHADDIGMHRDQTDGSLESLKYGLVRTGSIMVPCPDFDRVAAIWKQNPHLDLGIHLTLNSDWGEKYGWGGVLPQGEVPSLYNLRGRLWRNPNELMAHMDVAEALLEFEAQIVKALQAGLKPTHLDGHYGNYYRNAELADGVRKLSRKYNLPMKPHHAHREKMRRQGYVFPDTLWMFLILYGEGRRPEIRKNVYDHWLRNLKPGVHELLIHPSLMGQKWADILGRPNSYIRSGDYRYWTSPATKALADELGVIFVGYRALQKLQAKNLGHAAGSARVQMLISNME